MLISRVFVGTREFLAKVDTYYLDNFLNNVESTNQVFCSIQMIKKCIKS